MKDIYFLFKHSPESGVGSGNFINIVAKDIRSETILAQTDFGVRPYSLMMGSLKVADEVQVIIDVSYTKECDVPQ